MAAARGGRILFVRRRSDADWPGSDPDPWAGLWWLPGGALRPGEDPADGARRLLAEETGWRVRSLRRLLRLTGQTPSFGSGEVTVFLTEAPDADPDLGADHEAWRWDVPAAFHDQDVEARWRQSPDFRSWMTLAATAVAAVEDSLPLPE